MDVIKQHITDNVAMYNGDCVEVINSLKDESVDFSIFSPPFASLYTYSNSDRDMGNCKSDAEFFQHFGYLVEQLYRILKPGRLIAVHCMNLTTSKANDGYIGIRDFRGDIIRKFQENGFIYHSEVCIWKDPVVAMQRTKALGLLHKQVKKDSSLSRQGLPDYLVILRKPGDNENRIEGEFKYYVGEDRLNNFSEFVRKDGSVIQVPGENATSIDVWQQYASPVWHDIRQSNTLNFKEGRASDDERHICPLQLDVIERSMQLWTKEGDVVFTPFMGIGSEVYQAVSMGRKAIGVELKESYFDLAVRNVSSAESKQYSLF